MRSAVHEKSRAGQSAAHTTPERPCVDNDTATEQGPQVISLHGYSQPGHAARALLNASWAGETTISAKAGQFLGQISVDDGFLSDKQISWLNNLLRRAGFLPLSDGAEP